MSEAPAGKGSTSRGGPFVNGPPRFIVAQVRPVIRSTTRIPESTVAIVP
jgi:hypothetical protein